MSANAPVSPLSTRSAVSSPLAAIAVTIRKTPEMRSWMAISTAHTTRVSSGQTARTMPSPSVTRP